MPPNVTIVQFPNKPYNQKYYKNTHLVFGKAPDHSPILIFVSPISGNTPGIPFAYEPYDCHGMMTIALTKFIGDPNESTFKELLRRTPIIHECDGIVSPCYYSNVIDDNTPGFVQFSTIMKEIMGDDNFPKQIGIQSME